MNIKARVESREGQHQVSVSTDAASQTLAIPPKSSGFGSSVNGGELLFLALATCYCNDIYREATKRSIRVSAVEVEVTGEFGAAGEPATDLAYCVKITAQASEEDIRQLAHATDVVAEIHNTLRRATPVRLAGVEAMSVE